VTADADNTGSYDWLVPAVDSNQCLLRISGAPYRRGVSDTSGAPFTIYICKPNYDLNGDCFVDLRDLGLLTSEWLRCGNPFDPNCAS